MNVQSTTMNCNTCHNQTDERCSYCLLPVCPEHGEHVQPWFTHRQVLVCTPCQAKLQEIAHEEQSLSSSRHWIPMYGRPGDPTAG